LSSLDFVHQSGTQESLSFSNISSFGKDIIIWVEEHGKRELERIATEGGKFPSEEFGFGARGNNQILFHIDFQIGNPNRNESYAHIVDSVNGLQLYSFALSDLEEYGFALRVILNSNGSEENSDAIDRFKAMIRELAPYLEQERIEISFNLFEFDEAFNSNQWREGGIVANFVGYYDYRKDTFEINWD
jgi:hypothetical protein